MSVLEAILRGLASRMVYVRSYMRVRFGRTEHVCAHYRRYPGTAIY